MAYDKAKQKYSVKPPYINTSKNTICIDFGFYQKNETLLIKHILIFESYSPDLALCDFFLFPKIKSVLKEIHFSDIDSIKMAATTGLKKISEMLSKNVLNYGKSKCTSVFKWKGITLKELDLGIFQYFLINFL